MPDTKTLAHQNAEQPTAEPQTSVRIPKALRLRAATAMVEHHITLNQLLVDGLEMRLNELERTR